MTVKLSELRVSATMNAGQYKSGMDQKIAADNAGAASSQKLGASVEQNYQKISKAGSVVDRLSRQYVAGYAESAKFKSAIRALGRGMETGNVCDMSQASAILDGLYRKFGLAAEATQCKRRDTQSSPTPWRKKRGDRAKRKARHGFRSRSGGGHVGGRAPGAAACQSQRQNCCRVRADGASGESGRCR